MHQRFQGGDQGGNRPSVIAGWRQQYPRIADRLGRAADICPRRLNEADAAKAELARLAGQP